MSTTQKETSFGRTERETLELMIQLSKSIQIIEGLQKDIFEMKSDKCEEHEVAPVILTLKEERLNYERLALLVCPDDKRESLEEALVSNREKSTCSSRKLIDDIVDEILYAAEAREFFKGLRDILVENIENIEAIDKIIKEGNVVKEYNCYSKFSTLPHTLRY